MSMTAKDLIIYLLDEDLTKEITIETENGTEAVESLTGTDRYEIKLNTKASLFTQDGLDKAVKEAEKGNES